jgi:hypothetical protein
MVAMSVSELDRYLFDLNGFVVVRGVLEAEEVARLNEGLDQQGLDGLSDAERERKLEWLPAFGGPFLDLIDHQRILPYLIEFVDERVRLDHAYAIQMVAGTPGLGLHGSPDDRPRNCAWYSVRNGCISAGLTVVSFALTDVSASDGGFVCVAGSHKANFPCPFVDAGSDRQHPYLTHAERRAGDAVIFTEALTHGSGAVLQVRARAVGVAVVPVDSGRAGGADSAAAGARRRSRRLLRGQPFGAGADRARGHQAELIRSTVRSQPPRRPAVATLS